MNLNNLKIGRRLAIGFGSLLALMAVMFAVAFWQLLLNAKDSREAEEYDRRAGLVSTWAGLTELNITRTLAIAKAAGMPQVETHFAPMMQETSVKISEVQKELEAVISSEKGKALMAEVGVKRKVYLDLRGQLTALLKQGDPMAAEALLNGKVMPAAQDYLAAMRAITVFEHELAEFHGSEVTAGLTRAKIILSALLVAGLALGTLMAWSIARSVTAPVHEAVKAAEVIASGDLSHSVSASRSDELGDLLRTIGRMQESLRTLVGQVRTSTDSISTARERDQNDGSSDMIPLFEC